MTADSLPSSKLSQASAIAQLEKVRAEPSVLNLLAAQRQLDALATAIPHAPLKLACLSSYTFDPLVGPVRVAALLAGIRVDAWTAPFGQIAATLIDPRAGVDTFAPDVVLIASRLADVVPDLYDGLTTVEPPTAQTVADALDQLAAAISAFRQRSSATILIQNFERPDFVVAGLDESESDGGPIAIWRDANRRLKEIGDGAGNCHVMDYDALVARHGSTSWIDPRTEQYGRIPVAAKHHWDYGQFVVRHLRPLAGKSKKVIVLDADNTLWGGILGDDGLDGIQLGHDFPGNAFVRFQRRLLALQKRGIVLCVASKNEPGSVEHAIASHPEMVLRPDDFACMCVSWSPKPDAIREIAATLNLGLDSFVFIDDSAVECAMMREALPEVMTVQLPEDPARYAGVVASLDCFDQYKLSDEDRRRGAMYRAEADRKQLATSTVDLPSFYRGLQMRLTFAINDERRAARAAQMTQRTNQFNMHTIRCTEVDIRSWMRSADHDVVTLGLQDRFGDSGVVGLAVVRKSTDTWVLHMLLMSCRVLGRTVESTLIAWIAQRAQAAGAAELHGIFAGTAKNQPFADFYHSCGFERLSVDTEAHEWVLKLESADTTIPDWFAIDREEAAGP